MNVYPKNKFLNSVKDISAGYYNHGSNEPHSHEFIELVCIIDGEGMHVAGNEKLPLKSGDVLMLDVGVEHYYEVKAGERLVLCNCIFAPELLTEIITGRLVDVAYEMFLSGSGDNLASGYIAISGSEAASIKEIVLKIVDEIERRDEGYLETARALLSVAIIKLMRVGMNRLSPPSEQLRFKRELIDEIIDRIVLDDSRELSVKKLSREMFFSPEYLSRLFKKETGRSIISFIKQRKIERAANMLKETNLSIDCIMERVGYSDKKHFYELFVKTYSATPAKYRQKKFD